MRKIIKTLLPATALVLSACSAADTQSSAAEPNCASEAVIMVVSGETLDRDRMGQYAAAIAASGLYPKNQGYYLNSPLPVDVFEGDVAQNFVTLMVRFPSLAAARAFWDSETYQKEIKPLRLNPSAGDYTVTVYKEIDLPDYMQDKITPAQYSCQ